MGNVPHFDKLVHAFFHFVLTSFCFLFLKSCVIDANRFKPLIISFLFSVLFGLGIEIAQELLTETRHADILDFLANVSGATLAVGFVLLYGLSTKVR